MGENNVFYFSKKKNGKKLSMIASTIAITLILLNICMQMIIMNSKNINQELMNNNNLMIIQMFGHSKEKDTYFMDTEKAKGIEHLVFITESFPLTISLCDENGNYTDESVIIHKIEKKYSEYVGISDMKEGVIYCPKDSTKQANKYTLEPNFKSQKVRLENYDKNAPAILAGEDFAEAQTFDALMEKTVDREVLYSIPEYLIGVDSTEHIYSVVKDLKQTYSDYEVEVFYQANGLESLVSGSKNMLILQIIIFVFLILASCGILMVLLSSIVNSLTRELMLIHINGMSRKIMAAEFYKFILSIVGRYFIISELISFALYFMMTMVIFPRRAGVMQFVLILGMNVIVIGINIIILKVVIARKIQNNTSNEKISGMLRN